jgi:hypothetical protein
MPTQINKVIGSKSQILGNGHRYLSIKKRHVPKPMLAIITHTGKFGVCVASTAASETSSHFKSWKFKS